MEARWQRAWEQIVGDPALTDALTDTEAQVLLEWARGEVTYLVGVTEELEDDELAAELLASPLQELRRHIRWAVKISAADPDPLATLQWLLTPMTN